MAIKIGNTDIPDVVVGDTSISAVAVGSDMIWQRTMPTPLYFFNQAVFGSNGTVKIDKVGNPDEANIEYSSSAVGQPWTPYTFGTTLTVYPRTAIYFRAATDNNTSFYTDENNYYRFVVSGGASIGVAGNLDTLLNKYGRRHATKQNTYRELFKGCGFGNASGLELPTKKLPTLCYYGMFQNCTALKSAPELPATTIAASCYRSMFEGCTALSSAPSVLPATTTQQYCYSRMFYGCTALTDAPAISATTLTTYCFQNMFSTDTNLSSVSVAFTDWQADVTPTSWWLYNVAASGVFLCPDELSVVYDASHIPANWALNPTPTKVKYTVASGKPDWDGYISGELSSTSIPNRTYAKEIETGSQVTSIANNALSGNTNITDVTIGDSVTQIGSNAFSNCSALTNVSIGSGVTSIGVSAFSGCNPIINVYITDLAKWCDISFRSDTANPLYYSVKFYLNGVELTEMTIPNGVTSIGSFAFSGFSMMTSLTIPNSVTNIGTYAFNYCTGLTSVTIPESVTDIGSQAFAYCSNLMSVTFSGKDMATVQGMASYKWGLKTGCVLHCSDGDITL